MDKGFIYATRRSPLALTQCRGMIATLVPHAQGAPLEELQVVTSGDRIADVPLAEIGGKGLFVKEIEEALLEERADFAVHCVKDMPSALPSSLILACVPKRENPRDVIVAPRFGSLANLPAGGRVGTSSLRRTVALKRLRPDLTFLPIRGNVDTRLRKVDAGEFDALVIASAGLIRLGLIHRATEVLAPDVLLPAIGQGALGVECRESDDRTRKLLSAIHDAESALCIAAERGVMIALEGDCRTPLGGYAIRDESGSLWLRAFVAEPDGSDFRQMESRSPWPRSEADAQQIGLKLGRQLKPK